MMLNFLRIYYRQAVNSPADRSNFISLVKNYPAWRKSVLPGKGPLADGMPWISFDAINFLKRNLKKDMKVFEYGSGGSSVFFSKLTAEVISVEHDEEWFKSVGENIKQRGINNWKGILQTPKPASNDHSKDPENPRSYSTSDKLNLNNSFEQYVKSIDQYPDNYFDLIIVDGRSRPSCIMHSVPKLKTGGLILVDNAERYTYAKSIGEFITNGFKNEVDSFGPTSYSLEFTKTLIRRKM